MPFSWNEIRHRAIAFSNEWAGVRSEQAEKQTFWNEFFDVFGIRRRIVASFEEPVKKISGQYGYIDLFWPATVLVEHKSRGADLGKAESQAFQYIQDLAREGRMDEIPRYVIVSDFARIALHDLEPDTSACCRSSIPGAQSALSSPSPNCIKISICSPSWPATSSTSSRNTTRSTFKRSGSWGSCMTRWRLADMAGTI